MTIEFEHDAFRLDNGIKGIPLTIKTANPTNFYQVISDNAAMVNIEIKGKLFLPEGNGPFPVVIIVPGSLGLNPSHISKAVPLTEAGIAACLIDPFGARSVSTTVANQTQYSFAASAWDVLATAENIGALSAIDETRIGAQGHSRGGSAVLNAASKIFNQASSAPQLRAVYAAYPWSGQQFLTPDIGTTRVRAVIGVLDEWCLPQQVQSHIQAMKVSGGDASIRLFDKAHHSFDRPDPLENVEDASVTPSAPTIFIDDDGAFFHPLADVSDPTLEDVDVFMYAVESGYGRRGAHIGGGDKDGLAEGFVNDMMDFWTAALLA